MSRPSSATAVSLFAFVALAAGASPAHAWLDSGEIASAAASLGVMHPTGVPGLMPLMHLASVLPIGTLGFRFALVSAACGAGTIALLLSIMRRREINPWICAASAAWLLAGLTFSRQARVVEIYTFASLLLAGALWGFDPRAPELGRVRARCVGVFCAVLGVWGFGDLRLALALPVAVTWVFAMRKRRAWAPWAPLVVVLASLCTLMLALSSARAPTADWGDPDSAWRLWQHLNASSIRAAFEDQIFATQPGPYLLHGRAMLQRLAEDLGPLGPMAALVALVAMVRLPKERGIWAMLVGLWVVEVFYIVAINPMGGDDRQTGIPLAMVAVLSVGLVLGDWLKDGGPRLWLTGPLMAGVLVLPAATLSLGDYEVTRSWAPHAWTRDQLGRLAPESLLVTQSDDLAAGAWAARSLEGARPDLAIVVSQHLYRKIPDLALGGPAEAYLRPAFDACTESERARALVGAYAKLGLGPTVVEAPGSDMLAALDWRPDAALGLVLAPVGLSLSAGDGALSPDAFVSQARAEIDRLLPLLPSAEDRRRLATAVGARVRSWLRLQGHDEAHNRAAIATYRYLFEAIDLELPGPLVSLGALVDRAGDTKSAIELTRRALSLDADRRLAMSNLSLYLSRTPDGLVEALSWARRGAQLYPGQASSWRRLEQVCEQAAEIACAQQAAARRVGLSESQRSRVRADCPSVGTSTPAGGHTP